MINVARTVLGWLPVVGVFKGVRFVGPNIKLTEIIVAVSSPGSYFIYSMVDHKVVSLSSFHENLVGPIIKEFRFMLRSDGTLKSKYNKRIRRNVLRVIGNYHLRIKESKEYIDRKRNLNNMKWVEFKRQDNIIKDLIANPQKAVISIGK
jgi:hypothetical protein